MCARGYASRGRHRTYACMGGLLVNSANSEPPSYAAHLHHSGQETDTLEVGGTVVHLCQERCRITYGWAVSPTTGLLYVLETRLRRSVRDRESVHRCDALLCVCLHFSAFASSVTVAC